MIYALTGQVVGVDGQRLIVEVQGVGFGVAVAHPERYGRGDKVVLQTVLHWNQETGPQLFGFERATERELFLLVTGCSGMGPKLALSLLQGGSAGQVAQALFSSDTSFLSSIKGIGQKKAEALVLQLRAKVEHLLVDESPDKSSEDRQTGVALRDVAAALNALRYSTTEVGSALDYLRQHDELRSAPFDQLMRRALSYLARSAR